MTNSKIYQIDNNYKRDDKSDILKFIVGLFVYAVVLSLAGNLFRNLFISDFFHALIAATVLSVLNYTIKPILIYWTLPLTILSFGIAYPIVNMIILKLCDVLMGSNFEIHGFLSMFFIAIFISFLKIIFDKAITNRFGGR